MKHIVLSMAAFAVFAITVLASGAKAEDESSIARGGQLYDKWFAVIDAPKPEDTHKAWPASNTKKKGNATWRCKSCHGWDLRGKDGAYASGSYKTGIPGVRAYEGAELDKIIAIIKDDTHGMAGMMSDQDYHDLALFISKGQVDMTTVINADKSVKGNAEKGAAYYNTICAGCHGLDGKLPKELPAPLGALASGNPWEILAKIMNGQPNESMPAMRALPLDVSVDLLAYTVTLPKE